MSGLREEVRARRRRWIAARTLESVLVGGGAAAAALAAQRLSGPAPSSAAAQCAVLCGTLACAVLLRERWRDERSFTRGLDARLGARGALLTACEAERRGDADPLAALLGARTAALLARSPARASASPPSPLAVAALLGGLAVLAAVGRPDVPAVWVEVDAALARLEGLSAAEPAQEGEVAQALERLGRALGGVPADPVRSREVERRRDVAAARLASRASSAAGSGDAGGAAGAAPGGPAGGGASGSGAGTLAPGAGDRTMSRPSDGGPMQTHSRTPPGSDSGIPLARAATWPRRHDAVVAGYLERALRD